MVSGKMEVELDNKTVTITCRMDTVKAAVAVYRRFTDQGEVSVLSLSNLTVEKPLPAELAR